MNRHELKEKHEAKTKGELVFVPCPAGYDVYTVGETSIGNVWTHANAAGIVAEHNCTGRLLELLERALPELLRHHNACSEGHALVVADLIAAIDGDLEEPR